MIDSQELFGKNPYKTFILAHRKKEEELLNRLIPHLEIVLREMYGEVYLDEDGFYHPIRPGRSTLLITVTGDYINSSEDDSGEEHITNGDIIELWMKEHMQIVRPNPNSRWMAVNRLQEFLDSLEEDIQQREDRIQREIEDEEIETLSLDYKEMIASWFFEKGDVSKEVSGKASQLAKRLSELVGNEIKEKELSFWLDRWAENGEKYLFRVSVLREGKHKPLYTLRQSGVTSRVWRILEFLQGREIPSVNGTQKEDSSTSPTEENVVITK